jgi:LPXTG-site transpeptidase (sortase) family protein
MKLPKKSYHAPIDKDKNRSRGRGKVWRTLSLVIPILSLVAGFYVLSLVYAPKLTPLLNAGRVEKAINSSTPEKGNDRIYIQKLGINVPVKAGDASVMKDSVWHRYPERGNPVTGGNFIVSAHRWHRGNTPAETIAQSPFYNADRLTNGDSIFVDWEGKRYKYEIDRTYEVEPDQVEIEAPINPGEEAKLTLYTCTLKGAADGRVVVEAKLAEVI